MKEREKTRTEKRENSVYVHSLQHGWLLDWWRVVKTLYKDIRKHIRNVKDKQIIRKTRVLPNQW